MRFQLLLCKKFGTKNLILAGLILKSSISFLMFVFFSSMYLSKDSPNTPKCLLDKQQFHDENGSDLNRFYALYENLFSDIYHSSSQQSLIRIETLMTTLKFMIEEREEDDPELINFVQSLIAGPPNKPLQLATNDTGKLDFSQNSQSKVVDKLIGSHRNGFFVEAGAYDGETYSNSLFFEKARNWSGILIEPVPKPYASMVAKNRNAFTLNACICENKPIISKFLVHGPSSAREKKISASSQTKRIDHETSNKSDSLYAPCFSINTILKALDIEHIDYFSLDLQAGELDVIGSIKFEKIYIKSLTVRQTDRDDKKLEEFLTANNFFLAKKDELDLYFVNKK